MTSSAERAQRNTLWKDLAAAIFRHQRVFLLTVLAILSVTAAVTLLTAKQYESEMKILVQNAGAGHSTETAARGTVTEEQINSEIEVLSSKDLADNIVDAGWTSVPASMHSDTQIHNHDVAVARFRQRLQIELLHKSDIIQVTYTDGNPRRAHEMLARLLAAYRAKQSDLEQPGDATAAFASIAVVETPTLTTQPARPQVMSNLILGLFTAIFLGFCVIVYAEMGRDTVASPHELEAFSHYPVLTTVPFTAGLDATGLLVPLRLDQQRGSRAEVTPRVVARPRSGMQPAQMVAAASIPQKAVEETLQNLAAQLPKTSGLEMDTREWALLHGETPAVIAPALLLNPEPARHESAIITRSTVEHFPLPSVVPSAQIAKQTAQPVIKAAAQPAVRESAPAPVAKPRVEFAEVKPVVEEPAPAQRNETREDDEAPEKISESWTEMLSQRVLSTLRPARTSRVTASSIIPVNQAEVAYNQQGGVDYVTYTFNAPKRKYRGGFR